MFEQQLAFVDDPSPLRSLRAPRRAGKTNLAAGKYLLAMEQHPGERMCYVCPTLPQALSNVEEPLDRMTHDAALPVTHSQHEGQHYWAHENGASLWVTGCDNRRQADKFRGKKFRIWTGDEAGAWPSELLEYCVVECVSPTLTDYGGTMDLQGTPGPLPVGYWWEVDTGLGDREQWSTHGWTTLENPFHRFYKNLQLFREEVIERIFGGDETSPQFLREWRGLWAADENALIYRYDAARNAIAQPLVDDYDDGSWFIALGIDLGWHDRVAFTVSASRKGFREVHFLESDSWGELTVPQIAGRIMQIRQRYRINRIVIDTGGLGKTITETLKREYGLPCEPADKREKPVWIRNLSAAIAAGFVKFNTLKCRPLLAEYTALAWNDERLDHSPLCADDCADSALYSYRQHPIHETWEELPPAPGSPEALRLEWERHKMQLAEPRKSGRRRISSRARR